MKARTWEFYGRLVAAGVLAATAILGGDVIPSSWPLLAVCGVVALYNLASLRLGPQWLPRPSLRRTIILLVLDVAALTAYLHFSGDVENPLRFAYALPVTGAALLLSTRAGMALAASSLCAFGGLAACTWIDDVPIRLPHKHLELFDPAIHSIIHPGTSSQGMNYILLQAFRLGVVLFGAAWGFGSLAKRLRSREAELKSEHDRMRLLLNILPEGVVLLSNQGTIMLSNFTARDLIADWKAKSLEDLDAKLGVKERLSTFAGPVEEFETVWGNRILNHVLARTSAEGPIVWVLRDLTERRRMMAELAHRSKMADLGLLAAGIAHEIGNPLSSMSAILEVLEMKQAPPEILGKLRALQKHISRIGGIVQDVRSFAHPGTSQRTRVSGEALVAEALQIFRLHEKSANVTVELAPQDGRIRAEVAMDQVVQVLLNLLINGADACPQGGKITVSTQEEGDELRIAVTDNGCGMDEFARERLFTPFFTTKEPGRGMGLGLFVSESLARAHGGRILVESGPGRGSTFTLCLPRAPED